MDGKIVYQDNILGNQQAQEQAIPEVILNLIIQIGAQYVSLRQKCFVLCIIDTAKFMSNSTKFILQPPTSESLRAAKVKSKVISMVKGYSINIYKFQVYININKYTVSIWRQSKTKLLNIKETQLRFFKVKTLSVQTVLRACKSTSYLSLWLFRGLNFFLNNLFNNIKLAQHDKHKYKRQVLSNFQYSSIFLFIISYFFSFCAQQLLLRPDKGAMDKVS